MSIFIKDIRKINYELPPFSSPNYGGASIVHEDSLFMTTRDINNHSCISRYGYRISKEDELLLSLSSNDIFSKFQDYKRISLGQSYPHICNFSGVNILTFTDWYYNKSLRQIVNRMGIAVLDQFLQVSDFKLFKSGVLSLAGAPRLYKNDQFNATLYIPLFSKSAGKESFLDYEISSLEYEATRLNPANLSSFVDSISHSVKPKRLNLTNYFTKSTCLNILPSNSFGISNYLFAARNSFSDYSLFSIAHDSFAVPIPVLCSIPCEFNCLTYPFYFNLNDQHYLLVSTGRYGVDGLALAKLDIG